MQGVRIEVLKLVDTDSPGWVECSLVDASGTEYRFVEKAPVVLVNHESHLAFLPRPGILACEIIRGDEGEVVTIRTDVADKSGGDVFQVLVSQLSER